MRERSTLARFVIPMVVLLGLACGPCGLLSGAVPTPPHPIAVSTEAAGQLESRIQQSLSSQPAQQFILRMSDDEVTSLVATKLAQYDGSPVTNPVIWFTRGKIYGTGRLVGFLPIDTEFFIIAVARVQDGKVVVEMEKASTGSLPLPNAALDTISQSINETVEESQLGVEITGLEILEGEVIIRGVTQ
ncbi:MAG: hypothetical protein JXM73_17705 [Anaerolineae bacterium]|nr:hypothetical protein [Anaerolineae bacterium]